MAASQRARMLRAMTVAVAAKGYAGTVVADVVSGAGVSRQSFYEQFADKQECFLAAYEASAEGILAGVEEGVDREGDGLGQLRGMVQAYLGFLASEPAVARTYLIDVFAAGPEAFRRQGEVSARFAGLLARVHDRLRNEGRSDRELDAFDFEALVGAVRSIVTARVLAGDGADLPELLDRIERFLLESLA